MLRVSHLLQLQLQPQIIRHLGKSLGRIPEKLRHMFRLGANVAR